MATDVVCPVENCEYTGPVSSVEAHISRSVEGAHGGEVGRVYREGLTAQAEGHDESSADGTESGDATESSGHSGAALSVEGGTSNQGSTSDGLPVPVGGVDPRMVLAVLSVGAVLFLVLRTGSSASTATTAEDDGDEPEALDRDEIGGLA